MIVVTPDVLAGFRQTNRLLLQECLARGVTARVPDVGSSFLQIMKPDGSWCMMYGSAPPDMSYAAALMANNKFITHTVLSDIGMPVLPTVRIRAQEDPHKVYEQLKTVGTRLVVKPVGGSHGDGISINIEGVTEFVDAVMLARECSTSGSVIAQEMYEEPVDIRILCIGYKFVSAVHRIPARVCGDGVHTIEQLIEQTNQQPARGERYVAHLAKIDLLRARTHLGKAIHGVPDKGAWVDVVATANYGTGGETVRVTADIPEWLQRMAEQAAETMELPVCGVDFLLRRIPETNHTIEQLKPVITEVNKCPSLYIHEHPTNSSGDQVASQLIDYVLSRP